MEKSLPNFLEQCRLQHFAKGEIILVQGEIPTTGYWINKGVVKTYNLTQAGDEKPISFDTKGEIFPIAWLFSKLPYAQYFYEAFTDCEVYCLPKEAFAEFLQRNPTYMHEFFGDFVSSFVNYQMRINALEQSKATAKVLHTIHLLCLRFGNEVRKNVVKIELPLTQQDIANFMGLTRETTSMELKKLQDTGVISYKNQNYMVKTNRLNDLLDDEYNHGRMKT